MATVQSYVGGGHLIDMSGLGIFDGRFGPPDSSVGPGRRYSRYNRGANSRVNESQEVAVSFGEAGVGSFGFHRPIFNVNPQLLGLEGFRDES